jgi:hypothetical protein
MRRLVTSLLAVLALAGSLDVARAEDAESGIREAPAPDDFDRYGDPPRLDEVDTTITFDELRKVKGWGKAKRVRRAGDVMVVLHVDDGRLKLSVVEDKVGIVHGFTLGKAALRMQNHTFDGNAYPAASETGPIVFATRIYTAADAPDDAYRQVAVWADGATLHVAERKAGSKLWKPLLRVKFDKGTTFRGIGTTYPH